MKYSFDSSALIDLGERKYPQRIRTFAPIWEHLYQGIDDGEIISPEEVRSELKEKAAEEWRVEFLKRADRMFLIDEPMERQYAALIGEIEGNPSFRVNGHRKRFFAGADPWVIALARTVGECTVISSETKSLTEYGLGAICKVLGVPHWSLLDYFRAVGM